jgi:MFS family permease
MAGPVEATAGAAGSTAPSTANPGRLPGLAISVLVVTGPALRTALLGGLLVAEGAMGTAFGLDAEGQAILLEAVILGNLVAVFLLPSMMQRFGPDRVAALSALATVAILALGLAAARLGVEPGTATTTVLLVASLAAGFAVAVLAPVTQILLNHATEGDKRATHALQSLWNAGQPAGFVAASLIAGVLIGPFGWSAALLVPLGLAVVATAALVAFRMGRPAEPRDPAPATHFRDILVIVVALVAFELWSTLGTMRSWLAPGSLAALAVLVVAGGYALRRLFTSSAPAIPLAPYRDRCFARATLVLFLFQFATTAEFEVLLLADLAKMSAIDLGDRTAIGNIAQIAGTALAGVMLLRKQTQAGLLIGLVLTTLGLASYITYPWADGLLYVTVTRSVVGFGSGLVTPILFTLALSRITARDHVAAGTWLVIATIAGTEIGLALLDVVLDVANGLGGSSRNGYVGVEAVQFLIGLAVAIVGAALLWSPSAQASAAERTAPPPR